MFFHRIDNVLLRELKEAKTSRAQYQVKNETQIRRNQKVIKDEIEQLQVNTYPKLKEKNP